MLRSLLASTLLACGASASPKSETPPRPASPSPSADAPNGVAVSRVPAAEREMIGLPAPRWDGVRWAGKSADLAVLRGRVVLIRFFTDTCPSCRASAPALRELDETYRDRGLTVIGMYHPKPKGKAPSDAEVAAFAKEHGWSFPVGIDADWNILDAYWAPEERRYTSVSFILDKGGDIRFIHPGPEYHPGGAADHEQCRTDFADLKRTIEALL